MTAATIIHLGNIAKSYRGSKVLELRNFDLRQGDRLLVRGANGCGKSTLLRIIAGLTEPDQGKVVWPTQDRPSVTYLPQGVIGFPDLSIHFNKMLLSLIFAPGRPGGASLLSSYFADRSQAQLGTLSGGYRRLFALQQVCAAGSDVIILDEPISQLDDQRLEEAIGLIGQAARSAKVMIASQPTSKTLPPDFEALWNKKIDL